MKETFYGCYDGCYDGCYGNVTMATVFNILLYVVHVVRVLILIYVVPSVPNNEFLTRGENLARLRGMIY